MSSKREQLKLELAVKELLKLPENKRCIDCDNLVSSENSQYHQSQIFIFWRSVTNTNILTLRHLNTSSSTLMYLFVQYVVASSK